MSRGIVQWCEVVEVENQRGDRTQPGQQTAPRVHLLRGQLRRNPGENAVRGARLVLIRRMQRHRLGQRVLPPPPGIQSRGEVGRRHREAGEERLSMAQVPRGTYRAGDDSRAPASLSQCSRQIAHHM